MCPLCFSHRRNSAELLSDNSQLRSFLELQYSCGNSKSNFSKRGSVMKKLIVITSILTLLAAPVFAQESQEGMDDAPAPPTAEEIDASVKAINELAKDQAKVQAYCDILAAEDALQEGDTAASDAVAQKFDAFYDSLSPDAQLAFDLDETMDPTSEGAQKLGGAFLNLEDQCADDGAADDQSSGG